MYSYFQHIQPTNTGVCDYSITSQHLSTDFQLGKAYPDLPIFSPFNSISPNLPISPSFSSSPGFSKNSKLSRSSPLYGCGGSHKRKIIKNNSGRHPLENTFPYSLDNYAKCCSVLPNSTDDSIFGLPIIDEYSKDAIPRISTSTLLQVLNGEFVSKYNSILIIDARFWYEYQGGHISGATSCCSPTELEELFFSKNAINRQNLEPGRIAIIFHCEFSSHRAPKLALHMRKKDRALNTYPSLLYPELYVLQGGYCDFFKAHSVSYYFF